eukprot:403357381
MINQVKFFLKDFVRVEDIPKLSISYYKPQIQEEHKEEIKKVCDPNRQQYNIYKSLKQQAKKFEGYYKEYLKLVDYELKKESSSTISRQMQDWNRAELNLLYQGSRDGFSAKNFHQLCDNQGPTVAFVLSEYGQTFGGYTSVSWTSNNSQIGDSKAFLFQLNKKSVHPIGQNFDYSVHHNPDYLITFGNGFDLFVYNQCDINRSSYSQLGRTYSLPLGYVYDSQESNRYLAGEQSFRVLEIEVYSVQIT